MKKIIISILLVPIGFIALKIISKQFTNTDTILCHISNVLNRNNEVVLNCYGINKRDVNICWYAEYRDSSLVISSGKLHGKIPYRKGVNRFDIRINNNFYFSISHNVKKDWYSYKYEFDLTKDIKGYKLKSIYNGPDFIRSELQFDSIGRLNGLESSFFDNGNCISKGTYTLGLKQGQFVYYYRNGQIRSTEDYLDDKLNGYITSFDENGELQGKTKFINGQELKDNE